MIATGKNPLIGNLLESLGVRGAVSKVVIEITPREPIRVYVQKFIETKELEDVCVLLENEKPLIVERQDLEVDEKGNVCGS